MAADLAEIEVGSKSPTVWEIAEARPDFLATLGKVTKPATIKGLIRDEPAALRTLATRAAQYRARGPLTTAGDVRRALEGIILSDLEETDPTATTPAAVPEIYPAYSPRAGIQAPRVQPARGVAPVQAAAAETGPVAPGGTATIRIRRRIGPMSIHMSILGPVLIRAGMAAGRKIFGAGAVAGGAAGAGAGYVAGRVGPGAGAPAALTPSSAVTDELRALGLTRKKVISFARQFGLEAVTCLGISAELACEIIAKGVRRRGRGITAAQLRTTRNTLRKVNTIQKSLKKVKSCR